MIQAVMLGLYHSGCSLGLLRCVFGSNAKLVFERTCMNDGTKHMGRRVCGVCIQWDPADCFLDEELEKVASVRTFDDTHG